MPDLTYPERLRGLSIPLARGAPYIAGEWNVLRERRLIGHGADEFALAGERILSWQMHHDAGVRVVSSDSSEPARVGLGHTVSLALGWSWASIQADCEVVAVVDGDREAGFAYGTLPRHPECGEEAFVVRLFDDGTVVGSVGAFSRPARWFTQLMPPVSTAVQRAIARRYLDAVLGP